MFFYAFWHVMEQNLKMYEPEFIWVYRNSAMACNGVVLVRGTGSGNKAWKALVFQAFVWFVNSFLMTVVPDRDTIKIGEQ